VKSPKNEFIDIWRGCYSVVIPSIACAIYLTIYFLIQRNKIEYFYVTDSENFTSVLEAIISFVSMIIGVFGFLLPILITSKNEFTLVKYFINNIDKKAFSFNLRMIIVSGFAVVFASSMLFFFDIFSEWFKQAVILTWIWLLLYFMSNSYRFISLLIRLFLEEKSEVKKEMLSPMSDIESQNLKDRIRKNKI